jgi:hypothetical protein
LCGKSPATAEEIGYIGAGEEAPMQLSVREMKLSEVHLVIDYFHNSTSEYLDSMGVDPSRLLSREAWYAKLESEFALPLKQRQWFPVIWLQNGNPVGYSSCDRI